MSFRSKFINQSLLLLEALRFDPQLKQLYRNHFGKHDQPLVLFDVGVHYGESIKLYRKLFPQATIHGFEANRSTYAYLQKKFEGVGHLHLNHVGVSSQMGELTFQENRMSSTSTFSELNPDSAYLKRKSRILGVKPQDLIVASYPVPVITLSNYIQEQGLRRINLIKIDTEGHEYHCLQGLREAVEQGVRIDLIQIEHHEDDMYKDEHSLQAIQQLMAELGFELTHRLKHSFGSFEEVFFAPRPVQPAQ